MINLSREQIFCPRKGGQRYVWRQADADGKGRYSLMDNRWVILVILFFARTAMGFQHQAVASVSSLLIKDLNIDYARLGTLIGIYQLPGVVLAFPGGLLGNRFGDKRVVVVALGLMAIGGFVMGGGAVLTLVL